MYEVSEEITEKELTCANGHVFKKDLPANIYGAICSTCGHSAQVEKIPDLDWEELNKMMKARKEFWISNNISKPIELP
jgi:hypothetical protein